jgi:hypothetical protein
MVSVLPWSVVDRGVEPRSGKPKTIKQVFVASLLSMQYLEEQRLVGPESG